MVHCKGHQKGDSSEARGNQAAGEAAQESALKPVGPLQILVALSDPDLPNSPAYTEKEEKLATQKQASKTPGRWWTLPDGQLLVPEALGQTVANQFHQATHLGHTKLTGLLRNKYYIPNLDSIIALFLHASPLLK